MQPIRAPDLQSGAFAALPLRQSVTIAVEVRMTIVIILLVLLLLGGGGFYGRSNDWGPNQYGGLVFVLIFIVLILVLTGNLHLR